MQDVRCKGGRRWFKTGLPIYRQEPSRTDKNRQIMNKIKLKKICHCYSIFMSTDSETFKIQNVNSENDLGLIVDRGLKFSEHINKKISKANKILSLI